ncbi:MAG: hypothetical protein QOF09_3018 [Alphaproteobacteria bacterium]|jgi:hypothetical protein|nr:hypothetical protein [Alphaproteobacteria bacterium]
MSPSNHSALTLGPSFAPKPSAVTAHTSALSWSGERSASHSVLILRSARSAPPEVLTSEAERPEKSLFFNPDPQPN